MRSGFGRIIASSGMAASLSVAAIIFLDEPASSGH
jgi:hypothetical protein